MSKSLSLISCHGNMKGKFLKNQLKASKAKRGMKLILGTDVQNISCYILFFYCPSGFIAVTTLKFNDLQWESENWYLFLCHC